MYLISSNTQIVRFEFNKSNYPYTHLQLSILIKRPCQFQKINIKIITCFVEEDNKVYVNSTITSSFIVTHFVKKKQMNKIKFHMEISVLRISLKGRRTSSTPCSGCWRSTPMTLRTWWRRGRYSWRRRRRRLTSSSSACFLRKTLKILSILCIFGVRGNSRGLCFWVD